ncbi:MAG TPA: DUF445 family protein [Syntrophomonadaceae bacterium]|nr:DUF445 family protein [Syntrophomonadaceae bacterium]HPR94092.1 DUF445 family protein [Syntrophomonadaceae bacterium]
MNYQLLALPVISAFIGYITNVFAIRLLFWPKKPINLGFFSVQGILPKRQAQIAGSVGQLVEKELLSWDELFDKINTPEIREVLTDKISAILKDRLSDLLPRIVPAKVGKLIGDMLEKVIHQEASNIIKQSIEAGSEYLNQEINIEQMVEDKINAFDLDELEKMIRGVTSSELTFIEVLGGVLGFIIGLVQVAIIILFPAG